ncbi:MAG: aminodeoxychorismate synthase component I [Desulfobacterales bacterium]|nr:aminodeoxychorismate synthase component I [Desulfobacterales bacterium]
MGHLPQLPQIKDLFIREISLDLPFEKAAARFAHKPGTVLLLSGSDMDCARYNLLAVNPWLELKGVRNNLRLKTYETDVDLGRICPSLDPFDLVQTLLTECAPGTLSTDLPVAAGLFGYFAYDLKDSIEDLPRTCLDTRLPDIALYAPSVLLVQDRVTDKTYISLPLFDRPDAEVWIAEQERAFFKELDRPWSPGGFSIDSRGFTSSFTKPEYIASVTRVIDYLKAGDIYQANLAQRFETGFSGDAYGLFAELFSRNPASFFSYIHAGDHHVVSTSPERFIKLTGRSVETRPIKGTIARGSTPESDEENGRELAASLKDDAELTMIVDLMRNDISRVTDHGSVEVTEHKRLEPYENVFHLVSVVKGQLQENKTAVDLIRATFPGGSITGCPKIRSMEIIDELEPVKRHVYTGSIGYISFHNTMDLSIAIRTATITDNRLFFSVGGGIVYDSDPEKEFQETLDKGKTLMETLLDASAGRGQTHLKAWVNGKMVDQDRARVPVLSQGVQYGAGLFETIRVENGRPRFLKAHVHRLNSAWAELFHIDPPDITWEAVVDHLVRENRLKDQTCAVKLMAAKDGSREPVFLAAFIRPYVHRLNVLEKKGLDLVTFPRPRQTYLADYKTVNYLYYERAADYASAEGADEAIILNPDGSVSETNTCNIMAVKGNTLVLPESDHMLPGVTLAAVTDAAGGLGFTIRHEKMMPEALASCPNVLVTNSLMGAVPVAYINGIPIHHDPEICSLINSVLN